MAEIRDMDIRIWSKLGMRGTYGVKLLELAGRDDSIVALSADLGNTSGLERFMNTYPERYTNVGIAEQNMIGVAAGMADEGYHPFASTFANFGCLRANEFVKHFMNYMQCGICLTGLGAGYAMELFGNTHYGVEDIAAIRAYHNIDIICPADGLELVKLMEQIAAAKRPTYLRLGGKMNLPIVYSQDTDFEIGRVKTVYKSEQPAQVILIAAGTMVAVAKRAGELLNSQGIFTDIIDMHTLSRLDEAFLETITDQLVVTVEEHSIIGGLGSILSDYFREKDREISMICMGIRPEYIAPGRYEYMLEQMSLTPEAIVETVMAKQK